MENRIQELRKAQNWSQAEFATRLGVSRQTVNALERGRYDPSLPLAFKISTILAQPIEGIFIYDPS
ncbi:helix-turn-helix transcriptional regulator [Cochlodiniinecator piscidefendens]|uniref:helix-turn-helix transcriptional regulator n=1 Tax=Cochlodiniinecator piscidefendens TaxID=2715756 RepID=UPI001408E4FC